MAKKFCAFVISLFFVLSIFSNNSWSTAQAADGNPFAVQDEAREYSIQQSEMNGLPQKPAMEKKNQLKPKKNAKAIKDVYNVKFKDSSSLTAIYNCVSKYPYQLLGASDSRLFKITLHDLKSFKKTYSKILDSVSLDAVMKLYAAPNDQYFSEQWELPDINIPQAWDITKGSPDIKVAVIDTGFDRTHEDFNNAQILNGCDVTESNMPVIDDMIGHGTEVTGVIAAETNNAKGISGAGWNVSVIPYKVADEYGDIYESSVISAITMAADASCGVISMSLGCYYDDDSLQSAINYANGKGCIVIAAAGDEGGSGNSQAGRLSYPASCTGVVSVASVGRSNNRSCFSQYNSMVDVAAPGENVLVADPYSITGYTVSSGTSFSAPYVAAVAALAKTMNVSIDGDDFQNLIEESSTDLGTPLRDDSYGWGLLNAGSLLNDEKNPIVSGVNDHYIYNTSQTITFNRGTATLNGKAFASGSKVSADGTYVLTVTDASGNCTVVHFTIDKTKPVVSGVVNGGSYNTDRVITFDDGTATLNDQTFSSGDTVSDEGSYTLAVTDSATNTTTIQFAIDRTPPVISGVEDGATYRSSVKISFNEGSGTLNGSSVSNNATVSNAGSYTLAVTDAAGNSSTVGFTIADLPSITSVQLPSALTKWVIDGGSGEVYALSGSSLLFINPDTLQVDSTLALPATATDLIADSGKLYIALDSFYEILVVDIATRSTDNTLTTVTDPYRIAKDGDNLYYVQYDQWCQLHNYNLSTNKDTNITPKNGLYKPSLAVNPALHLLYIGESGSTGSKLYYYDENQKTFTSCNYGGSYGGFPGPSRNIFFDGTYMYYAGRMFQPDNPNEYSSNFLGSAGVINVINGCVITGSGTVFDRDTFMQIGSFSSNIGLADVVDNGLIYFNGSTKTLSRATCSSSIGRDTIAGLLGGTSVDPSPKPGTAFQVNASTQKMLINSSLCGWVQDDGSHMLYAISASSKSLYFINEQTLNVDTVLALNARPTDIQLSGGKIYVALDDAYEIAIIDPEAKTIERTIQTAKDPYQIAIDGNNLFYTQLDQWCDVRKYDLAGNTDSSLPGLNASFSEPDIAVNPSLHMLYIGDSNSTGSKLYYYDEAKQTLAKCNYDDGYGFYNAKRSIIFDGKYVYYANYAFDPGAPEIIGDLPGAGAFLLTNGSVIASTFNSVNSFFDADTFAKIGTSTKNFTLLAIGGDKIFAYSDADYSVTAIQSATGSVDSGNVVSLLDGTPLPLLKPTPGQKIDPATYSLAMAAPLSNCILDEATHTLMAISASERALLFINSDTMDLEKVIHLKSTPTDMISDGGKLYVALDVCNRIDVYDIQNRAFVSSIATVSDPNHIVIDGENIFYSTYGSAQWQSVHECNLASGSDKTISSGSLYNATLAVNTQDHILYAGETNLSSSYLYYFDTISGKQLGRLESVNTGSGKTLYDGKYVYYSGGVYDGKTLTLLEDDGVNFIYAKNGMAFTANFALLVGQPDLLPLPISADIAALSDDFSLFLYGRSSNIVMKCDSSCSTLLASKISGLQNGGIYPDQAAITFSSGTAYLDNQPYASGTTVTAHGMHRLLYFDNNCSSLSLPIDIYKSVQSISLDKTELTLDINGKANLTATVLPADADLRSVTWSTSDSSIATVNSAGRVVGKGHGDCVITAAAEYSDKTAACQVHVTSTVLPAVKVQSVTMNKKAVQMNNWDIEQLSATVNPADADDVNVTWSSNNEDVVEVDDNGYIYAFTPGTATVTVTTQDGHFTDSCIITVVQPVRGILLNKHTDKLAKGSTDQLSVFFAPSDATNKKLTWSSSDNSVATVDQKGLVKAMGAGSATITATSQDNAAIHDSCQINVISVTVTFDTQGGNTLDAKIAAPNSTIPAPLIPIREHYTFKGWFKEAQCKNAWVFATSRVPAHDITLYAKWAVDMFTVSFDSQGGSKVSGKTAGYGATITAPAAPKRTGYAFGGWYKQPACEDDWVFGVGGDTVTAAATLYAKWNAVACNVTLNANGGTIDGSPTAVDPLHYGDLIPMPSTPAKAGYVFGGWYTSANDTTQWNFSTGKVTKSITLYAKWMTSQYRVAFDAMGGAPVPSAQSVDWNQKAAEPAAPAKAGYFFGGWYTSSKYFTDAYKWDFDSESVTNNVTLYARWVNTLPTPGVSAVASAADSVGVSCTAVQYATGYRFFYASSTAGPWLEQDSDTPNATIPGLDSGLTYCFKAQAYCEVDGVQYTSAVSPVVWEVPGKPGNPAAAATDYRTIHIEWASVPRSTDYEVWRATSPTGKYSLVTTTASTEFNNTVNTGTAYYYEIRAFRLVGTKKVYGLYSDIVSAQAMLAAITNPAAVSTSATGVTISWDGVTGASGYEIWCATADTGVFKLLTSTSLTSYPNKGLVTNQPYYYKVRAYRIVGGTKVYGTFTSVMIATPGS